MTYAQLHAENKRLRDALTRIEDYWLGPTAVCQVHVDHMKDLAHLALTGKHRVL